MPSPKFSSAMKTIYALLLMLALSCAVQAFKGSPKDGAGPSGQLALDAAGNIYGTTESGGAAKCLGNGCGTAFRLGKTGKEAVYSFDGGDGSDPQVGLTINARQGVAYGTTVFGGGGACLSQGCGTVFKLSVAGTETVLHEFAGSPDGWLPIGQVVQDASGNLYGTTEEGGDLIASYGTIYKVDSRGNETVLYSFTGGADGCFPGGGLTLDAAGNLYGAATGGCTGSSAYDGDIFELDPAGELKVLYTFGGGDGAVPAGPLMFDSTGNLYGVTFEGGSSDVCDGGCGTAFSLSPNGSGGWSERVLYSFCSLESCADGQKPNAGLLLDADGNLYGTAANGGASRCFGAGCGVVFEIAPGGGESVLHNFTGGAGGFQPGGALAWGPSGELYGVATGGGDTNCIPPNGCGIVFRLSP